jgi:hypothetical protein
LIGATNAHGFGVAVYPQLTKSGGLSGLFREIRRGASFYNATVRNFKKEAWVIAIGVETDFPWLQVGSGWAFAKQTGTLEDYLDSRHMLKSEWCSV